MSQNDDRWSGGKPNVLVFDVNETLIDIEAIGPLFERLFGDARVLREWFGQLVMYSMTLTLSGLYKDFWSLGGGVLQMLGEIHGRPITAEDIEALKGAMRSMPAHSDVEEGLRLLRDAGFRMVTLTNSPPSSGAKSPLENAGLDQFFERQFSVQTARSFKPSSLVYHMVAQELDVPPAACCMVAAHVWDTIGAQSIGMAGALITRPGNAPLPLAGVPQPDAIAPNLPDLAREMIRIWRP